MGQDATTSVLKSSVLGTTRVFVVLLAGFLSSKWPKKEPLLTKESCRSASRICTLLFLPALIISSTGATLNPAALRDSWQLVGAGSLTIALSGIVAWAFGRLLLGPEARRAFRPVQLAIAFPNSASFPLLLVESLCEQDDIKRDYNGDAAECFTQATGMIFIYVVVWQIWFFSWGFYALGDDDTLERKLTGQPARLRSPPPETEEGDKRTTSCKSSDVLARTTGTEGTVSEGSTQKAAADDMVAIDINVQLDDALMAPSSARPGHRGTNGVDSAYNGGGGGGGGGEVVDGVVDGAGVDGGEHMVGELVVAAGCAADGVPPRNEDSVGLPPARTIPQGKNGLAYKRFALNRWRSNRGNSDNSSSSKAVAVSDTAEGGPADSGWARVRQRAVVVLVSPNMIGVAIGIIIAMISPLQRMLFDSPQAALRPLGAAIETPSTPSDPSPLRPPPLVSDRGTLSPDGGHAFGGRVDTRHGRQPCAGSHGRGQGGVTRGGRGRGPVEPAPLPLPHGRPSRRLPPHFGSRDRLRSLLGGENPNLGHGREPADAPRLADRVGDAIGGANYSVPQSGEAACYSRLYGAALHLAVRALDVHYHLLDSSRRAHGVLRDRTRHELPVDPATKYLPV